MSKALYSICISDISSPSFLANLLYMYCFLFVLVVIVYSFIICMCCITCMYCMCYICFPFVPALQGIQPCLLVPTVVLDTWTIHFSSIISLSLVEVNSSSFLIWSSINCRISSVKIVARFRLGRSFTVPKIQNLVWKVPYAQ